MRDYTAADMRGQIAGWRAAAAALRRKDLAAVAPALAPEGFSSAESYSRTVTMLALGAYLVASAIAQRNGTTLAEIAGVDGAGDREAPAVVRVAVGAVAATGHQDWRAATGLVLGYVGPDPRGAERSADLMMELLSMYVAATE